MNKKMLATIKNVYENNQNIISYLKSLDNREQNTVEDILISYDFQAGSYLKAYLNGKNNSELINEMRKIIYNALKNLGGGAGVLEAGVGEATSMGPIFHEIPSSLVSSIYGFDISWSRIKYAEKMLDMLGMQNVSLFVADMLKMPIKDNAVDLVYTIHAIEPNGGKEIEILKELYRVTKRYLLLFEPIYEMVGNEGKERMQKHGYIKGLYDTAIALGYDVIKYEMLKNASNPLNPTGIIIIEKSVTEEIENVFCDPVSSGEIVVTDNVIYCEESMLMYPIIKGIPCLLEDNAIFAAKYNDFK